jgi:hypothetical protein
MLCIKLLRCPATGMGDSNTLTPWPDQSSIGKSWPGRAVHLRAGMQRRVRLAPHQRRFGRRSHHCGSRGRGYRGARPCCGRRPALRQAWASRGAPGPASGVMCRTGRMRWKNPGEVNGQDRRPSQRRAYRKLLAVETDETKRQTLFRLLAEEEAKVAALQRKPNDERKRA